MVRLKRKEREHLAHRMEILLAAEKVFADKGFFPTTMSEIAREAEFGTGTLYKYFRSKEDLYFSLIDEKVQGINEIVKTELSKKGAALERIDKALKLQLEFIEKNKNFFKIYVSERNRFEWTVRADLGKAIHKKMVTYIKALNHVVKQGIKAREFKSGDSMDFAHALVGIINSFVFEWLISSYPYPLILKKDTILGIFLKGVQNIERRK